MSKKKQPNIWKLVFALVLVVAGSVLFVGAVGGWFGVSKVKLEDDYYCKKDCESTEMIELSGDKFEQLMNDKKSFVIFVDQGGCTTADRLEEYTLDYMHEKGIIVYKMMFEDLKKTSLHESVKFYPSLVVISKGRVMTYLRADEDDDAKMYNNYDDFKIWLSKWL